MGYAGTGAQARQPGGRGPHLAAAAGADLPQRAPQPRGPDAAPPELLVLRALGLGDFLTAVPAFRALERAHPGRRIRLAAPPAHAELLALAELEWDLLPTEGPNTPPWPRAAPPDAAVNLHGSGPESTRALQALGPGRLWAHAHPGADGRGGPLAPDGPAWPDGMHDVDIWCRLLAHYGISADPGDLRLPLPRNPAQPGGTAVVHPGAAHAARRWPADRFATVARHLAARGLEVAVTGSQAERPLALEVAHRAGLDAGHVLAGRTPLRALAGLVAQAALMVCGDTGAAHLATAYSTPSVVLFGPVDPALWGPRIDSARHTCLWRGGRGDPHGDVCDAGLLRIEPSEVVAAAERMLAQNRPFSGPGTVHPPRGTTRA
ncbi:glycosyltransferase family 9 protein [Streptomonospora sediminis]